MKQISRFKDLAIEEDVVILGNGINQLRNNQVSWKAILEGFVDERDLGISLDFNYSYPLIFEYILNSMRGEFQENLSALKRQIVERINVEDLINDYHHQITSLPVSIFLTTNYDYVLETAIDRNFKPTHENSSTKRYKYSERRFRTVSKEKRIWHIHGEASVSRSIMIGHEHYADNARRIHELLKPMKQEGTVAAMKKRIEKGKMIWLDFFFTHNLHIAGLNITRDEFHLWWLLHFRARLIKQGASIINNIKYYYPSFEPGDMKMRALEAVGVELVKCSANRDDFYKVYDRLAQEILASDS